MSCLIFTDSVHFFKGLSNLLILCNSLQSNSTPSLIRGEGKGEGGIRSSFLRYHVACCVEVHCRRPVPSPFHPYAVTDHFQNDKRFPFAFLKGAHNVGNSLPVIGYKDFREGVTSALCFAEFPR